MPMNPLEKCLRKMWLKVNLIVKWQLDLIYACTTHIIVCGKVFFGDQMKCLNIFKIFFNLNFFLSLECPVD